MMQPRRPCSAAKAVFMLCRGWRAARNVLCAAGRARRPRHRPRVGARPVTVRLWRATRLRRGHGAGEQRRRPGRGALRGALRGAGAPSRPSAVLLPQPALVAVARVLGPSDVQLRGERAPRSASPAVDKSGRNALDPAAALLLIACLCTAVRRFAAPPRGCPSCVLHLASPAASAPVSQGIVLSVPCHPPKSQSRAPAA
jgi:hypothetical protein